MLQGYFDDSGTQGQNSIVTLAGFVSNGNEWSKFSEEWDLVLKKHHIEVFKMQKESKRRPVEKRNARIGEFVEVIVKNIFLKAECSISVTDFKEVILGFFVDKYAKTLPKNSNDPSSLGRVELMQLINNYYFWGFHNLVASVCGGIWHRGFKSPFDLVFDEQVDGRVAKKSYILARNELVPPKYRRILPQEPAFRSDHDFVQLQAADLFAWISRRVRSNEIEGWEWLIQKLEDIESIQCPFLDKNKLLHQIKPYIEYQEGDQPKETLERWTKILRDNS